MIGWLLVVLSLYGQPVWAAVVLQYHHISTTTPASTSTSPVLFRQHMTYLQEQGFDVVGLPELLQQDNTSGLDKRVAITFDDGYLSVYQQAFPELKRRGWPFTVFVNTRPLDQGWQEFVSWSQLREMALAGATIANHTVSHGHLIRRQEGESDRQWRQRIERDIVEAESRIEQETGQSHRILAYPFGEYDLALAGLVRSLGFTAMGQHSGPLGGHHSAQALPRFPFGGPYGDLQEFITKVNSLPMPLQRVGGRLAGEGRLMPLEAGDLQPRLPVGEAVPELWLDVDKSLPPPQINCFATGQGQLQTRVSGLRLEVLLSAPLPTGRSRINCTAAAGKGRFYWFSQPFVRPDKDGQWPSE